MRMSHRIKLAHKRQGLAKGVAHKCRYLAWKHDLVQVCDELATPTSSPMVRAGQAAFAALHRFSACLRRAGMEQARIIRGQF